MFLRFSKEVYFAFIVGFITCASFLYTLSILNSSRTTQLSVINTPIYWENKLNQHMGHHVDDDFIASELKKKVRIFCMILTMPANKDKRAVHVKAIWAHRCNKFLFISSENDNTLPSIQAVKTESRNQLWNKTKFAFFLMDDKYLNDFDFFFKADDDTYAIVENLRFILKDRNASVPVLMGRHFKPYVKQGYPSGGAGYVVSRAGLHLIVKGIRENINGCNFSEGAEDVNLGRCADKMGVQIVESLDEHGKESFHPFPPSHMMSKNLINLEWFRKYNYHKIISGFDCCSDHSVSFHYIDADQMYAYDYLIYHLYPYGIIRDVETYRKSQKLRGL